MSETFVLTIWDQDGSGRQLEIDVVGTVLAGRCWSTLNDVCPFCGLHQEDVSHHIELWHDDGAYDGDLDYALSSRLGYKCFTILPRRALPDVVLYPVKSDCIEPLKDFC